MRWVGTAKKGGGGWRFGVKLGWLKTQQRWKIRWSNLATPTINIFAQKFRNLGSQHPTLLSITLYLRRVSYQRSNPLKKYTFKFYKSFFCSNRLPQASTRWLQSTFTSHCPLSSKQHRWLTSASSTIYFSEKNLGTLGIDPWEALAKLVNSRVLLQFSSETFQSTLFWRMMVWYFWPKTTTAEFHFRQRPENFASS